MTADLARLDDAAALVHTVVPATPQYCWPLLSRRTGTELWVKHENHTPIGAFKLRGGLVYLDELRRIQPQIRGVITATRGNHGQSIAYAASRLGLAATIVVPHGNSVEKNRAMERSEEHTSELQSRGHLVCRLLLEKKKHNIYQIVLSKQEKTRQIMKIY